MTTIDISECYALHIHVHRVLSTTARHLEITSTFTGAKDPQSERRLLDVTLDAAQYQKLIDALKNAP